jgi:amino acid transporter
MNRKRVIILISAVVLILLLLWHDLPIQFPYAVNIMMLYLKISIVVILAFIALFFAGRKKKPAEQTELPNGDSQK